MPCSLIYLVYITEQSVTWTVQLSCWVTHSGRFNDRGIDLSVYGFPWHIELIFGGFANSFEVRNGNVAVHGVYNVSLQTFLDSRGIKSLLGTLTNCHGRCRCSKNFSTGRFGRFV